MVKQQKDYSKNKGLTLTEVAIVLAIIGLIMAAIWAAAEGVYANRRISRTQYQIMQIVQKMRALYGVGASNMLDMSLQGTAGAVTLARAGLIPQDMVDDPSNPTVVQHLWSDDVAVSALSTNANGDSFMISLVGLPQSACSQLLVQMTGVGRDDRLMRAGTTTLAQTSAQMPINVQRAIDDCSSNENTLVFSFMLKF